MRAALATLVALAAAVLPAAAHADTVDVMTVTGGGHTYVFDFPSVETIHYQANLAQFVPGLTPLSASIDGTSVTPTNVFFHPGGLNIIGPFGTIMYLNVLQILSETGPYFDNPAFPQGYDTYTAAFVTGSWPAFGSTFNGGNVVITDFTVSIQPQSVTTTPEPSSLLLLATGALGAFAALKRRLLYHRVGQPAFTGSLADEWTALVTRLSAD